MTSKLSASYYGYVGSTKDALLIIQAILNKQLEVISRRPHEKERTTLIRSGNVFVFIEQQSGIKRWTDGIAWSPSRILGRFLVYRELDKHSASEKDDKKKKKRKISNNVDPLENKLSGPVHPPMEDYGKNLVGSLMSSYVFKDQGLIKKTLSLTTTSKDPGDDKEERHTIHLISYYNADDVFHGRLQRPSEGDLKNVSISENLWDAIKDSSLGGKIPIEDEASYFLDTNYQLQNMALLNHPHMRPTPPGVARQLPQRSNSMLPYPATTYYQKDEGQSQYPNHSYVKREDEGELTFVNPFASGTPQGGQPQSAPGPPALPATTPGPPYFNNGYSVPQLQFAPNFVQTQMQDSGATNNMYNFSGSNTSSFASPTPQQNQHFAPALAAHHFQQNYPHHHFSLASSELSLGTNSNGSVSSITSNLNSHNLARNRPFRASSSGSNGSWFTTVPQGFVGNGGYVGAPPMMTQEHIEQPSAIASEDTTQAYVTGGTNYSGGA